MFYFNGKEYLLVCDYFSRFPFIRHLPQNCSSEAVIDQMKQIFSEQGIPLIFRSDNAPQYASRAFRNFTETYGFLHVTSSPYYPQSKGFIEAQVKIVKRTLAKMDKDNGDPYLGMLCLRSTPPVDNKLPSPAELLQQRPFRDNLLKLIKTAEDGIVNHLQQKQQTQKGLYDRHAKPLSSLSPGQNCRVRDTTTCQWQPAVIKETEVEP